MKTIELTPTEITICKFKCLGLQNKEIADRMQRAESTLKVHFKNMHAKLHVNNEVELVVWYIENVMNINIRKFIQVTVLLAILIPSMLTDESNLLRAQRSARTARTMRTSRNRRSETDYYLPAL